MNTAAFDSFDNKTFQRFSNPSLVEKDLQTLVGIINGINSDNVVNQSERSRVSEWINTVKAYEHKKPYSEIIQVLRDSLADDILTQEECENIVWYCNQYINKIGYYDMITSGIQQLTGIIHGIAIDNEINLTELSYLDSWLEENEYLKNTWPFDEFYNLTTKIIQDKLITHEEHDELLDFCNAVTNNEGETTNSELISTIKKGFYQIDPDIEIQGNTFCITGLSKKYKRRDIAERIELFGGYVVDNISSKLNYLIVCDEKNNCWAFTCYGRKIEQAVKHRKEGHNLIIVHEFDLYDTLEKLNAHSDRL